MNRDKIKQVAKSIMFRIDEKILNEFDDFFESHLEEIENLKSIDTTNVLPMVRIDEKPVSFMREDEIGEILIKEKILENASEKLNGYIVISKNGENND